MLRRAAGRLARPGGATHLGPRGGAERMKRYAATALVAANLFVAAVAILGDWGYYAVLLVFWWEAVIIGFYNVGRMFVTCLFGEPLGRWVGFENRAARFLFAVLLAGFFVFKFGGFALGTGLLVLVVPGLLVREDNSDELLAVSHGIDAVGSEVLLAVAALFVSHGVSFFVNYIGRREYRRSGILLLLFWPYARLALVFAVVIAGLTATQWAPQLAGAPVFAVAMILLKLLLDLATHLHERARGDRGLHGQPVPAVQAGAVD
jgi:hypothetical protein